MMNFKFNLKDSRGKESTTLSFVTLSFFAIFIKFILAGVNLGPLGIMPPMTALEFGGATGMILGIWLGREFTEKKTP